MKKDFCKDLTAALKRCLDDQIAAGAPGAILTIDTPRIGKLISLSSGYFARGTARPLRAGDPFRAASVTKTVTAASAVRLVSEGRLRLDDPISPFLPSHLVDGLSTLKRLDDVAELTLRRLLSHTAGLPDYFFDKKFQSRVDAEPLRIWRPEELAEAAIEIGRLDFPPGKGFRYGDTGYVLVGLAIEHITGCPLADAYRALIFEPLGMETTYLEWHERPRATEVSHHYQGDRDLLSLNTSFDWGGGGLVTTGSDLVRFVRGFFDGSLFGRQWLDEILRWRGGLEWRAGSSASYLSYGLGVGTNGTGDDEIMGATGVWGAFAYYWPSGDAAIAGTVNQVGVDRPTLVGGIIDIIRQFTRDDPIRH